MRFKELFFQEPFQLHEARCGPSSDCDSALGPITDEAAEASAPTSRARENGGANREHDDRQDDLKRALNEARKSAARLRQIIDTIPLLPWCSLPGRSNAFMDQRWLYYT